MLRFAFLACAAAFNLAPLPQAPQSRWSEGALAQAGVPVLGYAASPQVRRPPTTLPPAYLLAGAGAALALGLRGPRKVSSRAGSSRTRTAMMADADSDCEEEYYSETQYSEQYVEQFTKTLMKELNKPKSPETLAIQSHIRGQTRFDFVELEEYCQHLEDFADRATIAGRLVQIAESVENEELVAPPPQSAFSRERMKRGFVHSLDFSNHVERLRSRKNAVLERRPGAPKTFMKCVRDGEVIAVLQLKKDEVPLLGGGPEMNLRTLDWPIDEDSQKDATVPPHVMILRYQLETWLEKQGYKLTNGDPGLVSHDPFGI